MKQDQFTIDEIYQLIEDNDTVTFLAVMIKYYLERGNIELLWDFVANKR